MSSLDEAHARLLEAVRASRRNAMTAEASQSLHYAREALVSVWPLLPGMIEDRLGEADARIFSREELRAVLADFAVELLIGQSGAIDRWINARYRMRQRDRKAKEP